jgi:excisionase family DNA binding protein
MNPNEPILVTSKEAAKLLNISERTLWTITNSGQIPCVRILGAKRYHRSDIDQFIRNNTIRNTPTVIEQNNQE